MRLAGRVLFLLVLGGGLLLWAQLRRPREMRIEIDLSAALPGEIVEVDAVVRRSGHMLARQDLHYGAAGAPGLVPLRVRAAPGEAEVEAMIVYAARPASRLVGRVTLSEDAPARLSAP